MLNEEVVKYRELSGDTNPNVSISRIGGYLDGYEKALEREPCEDAITRILKRMWNCRGKHATSIDKIKMEQILRDELPSVNLQQKPNKGHWIWDKKSHKWLRLYG